MKKNRLQILADENMPFVDELFSSIGDIRKTSGRQMTAEDLKDVDILLVRSVTQVNADLIAKANKLKFVGSATAGTDHLDFDCLSKRGIHACHAKGCNKVGVAEYVLSALFALSQQDGFSIQDRKVGIIGAGQVGTYLTQCLEALNIPYMLNDPLLEKSGDPRSFVDLTTLLKSSDVVTLHVPMTRDGEHPTHHLLDEKRLHDLRPDTILINAARGAVVDNVALLKKITDKKLHVILDVFENEPSVNLDLLHQLTFATPHIAGYGLEGKARGTYMIYRQVCDYFNLDVAVENMDALLPEPLVSHITLSKKPSMSAIGRLCQLVYDIRQDDALFRRVMLESIDQRSDFDQLRKKLLGSA